MTNYELFARDYFLHRLFRININFKKGFHYSFLSNNGWVADVQKLNKNIILCTSLSAFVDGTVDGPVRAKLAEGDFRATFINCTTNEKIFCFISLYMNKKDKIEFFNKKITKIFVRI